MADEPRGAELARLKDVYSETGSRGRIGRASFTFAYGLNGRVTAIFVRAAESSTYRFEPALVGVVKNGGVAAKRPSVDNCNIALRASCL